MSDQWSKHHHWRSVERRRWTRHCPYMIKSDGFNLIAQQSKNEIWVCGFLFNVLAHVGGHPSTLPRSQSSSQNPTWTTEPTCPLNDPMIQSLDPLISGEWRMNYSLSSELVTNESWCLINDHLTMIQALLKERLSDQGEQGIVHIWSSLMITTW